MKANNKKDIVVGGSQLSMQSSFIVELKEPSILIVVFFTIIYSALFPYSMGSLSYRPAISKYATMRDNSNGDQV